MPKCQQICGISCHHYRSTARRRELLGESMWQVFGIVLFRARTLHLVLGATFFRLQDSARPGCGEG